MLKYCCLLWTALTCMPLTAAHPEELLVPAAPGGAFITGEALRFDNAARKAGAYEVLRLPEFSAVRSGRIGEGESPVIASLPQGYYVLRASFAAGETIDVRFAVLPDPAANQADAESFFALDAPLSVLVTPRQAEKAVEIARRSGVKFIRERNPIWHRVEPRRGEPIDYGLFGRHMALFAAKDIRVLSMYHTSPDWSRPLRPDNKMPDDLFALYSYSRRIAAQFGGQCPAFEFWNEMDFGGVDSVWDYAACLKAASLGYKAGSPDAKVLNGGFAIEAGDLDYHHVLMENGAGHYLDVLSIHSYGRISGYPGYLQKAFRFLAKHHASRLPVWYTETGCRAEGKGKLAHDGNQKEHTLDQELLVAEFLVKQMIAAQYSGAERDFFFSLYPCNEERGAKVWGLTRRDTLEVKAPFAAFANLIREAGAGRLIGRATGLPDGVSGFLYRQPDGSHTLVVWRESALDHRNNEENLSFGTEGSAPVSLPVPNAGRASAVTIFGTPVPLKNDGGRVSFALGRMPVYLRGAASLPAAPPVQPPRAGHPKLEPDKTIVFQAIPDPSIEIAAEAGPWNSKPRQLARFTAADGRATVFVYNFSEELKTGSFAVTGAKVEGAPAGEFRLEPMSKKEFRLKLTPSSASGKIIFSGRFNGRETTPLVMPYRTAAADEDGVRIALKDESWRLLSSGRSKIGKIPAEGAWEFKVNFADSVNDRWFYPEYRLRLPGEELRSGDEIAFELALDSPPEELKSMLLLAFFKEGGKQDFKIPLPAERGRYVRVVIPLRTLGREVRAVAVGGNLKSGNQLAFRLRKFEIIRK